MQLIDLSRKFTIEKKGGLRQTKKKVLFILGNQGKKNQKPLKFLITQSKQLRSTRQLTTNFEEDLGKREPAFTVGGISDWHRHFGDQCGELPKSYKQRQPVNQLYRAWHLPRGLHLLLHRHLLSHAHHRSAHSSSEMEATHSSYKGFL